MFEPRSDAPKGDPIIACILSLSDVREAHGGHPRYLSSHIWAEWLTALEARGWTVARKAEEA